MNSSLVVESLVVRFGSILALDGVNLRFDSGVNGILGPNGAGKTTLFRVVTGSLKPQGGRVVFNGSPLTERRDFLKYQQGIGYMPQDPGWFEGFSSLELCGYIAGLRGVPRKLRHEASLSALESVGLSEKADAKLGDLSGGQLRRAFIAQALVHDPQVLILDEPTSGLDPVQRINLRELINEIGKTRLVLLSTHLVEDVVHISQKVFIMDCGHLVWDGKPNQLLEVDNTKVSETDSVSAYERGFLTLLAGNNK